MDKMEGLLENLNKEQLAAVQAVEGPVMVFAGAGTGKTRALTARIAYMIQEKNIMPYNILAITFTKKATNEMRERVSNIVGDKAKYINISTIHALCAKILRMGIDAIGYKKDFEIIDDEDALKVLNEIYKDENIDRKYFSPKAALNIIGNYKIKEARLGITDHAVKIVPLAGGGAGNTFINIPRHEGPILFTSNQFRVVLHLVFQGIQLFVLVG